jgi:hypothetical protein
MTESRLEEIVHVVVAKPIAWTLYRAWQAAKWVGREGVRFGRWARSRWAEFKQKRSARRSSQA